MADSIRRVILDAMNTQLALITTANSYETNIGNNINEKRDLESNPYQESESPALNYDYSVATTDITGLKQEHIISISAEIAVSNTDIPDMLDKAVSDVIKNLGTTDNLGNTNVEMIAAVQVEEGEESHKERKIGTVGVSWQVYYSTNRNDPYSNS